MEEEELEKKGKKNKKKKIKILLIIIAALLGIIGILIIVFLGSVMQYKKEAQRLTKNVTEDTFKQVQTSIIYDIDGNEITSLSGIKELYYVDGDKIPNVLKQTFVLIEDRDFYKHKGVDMSSMFRAAIANIRRKGIVQGASTITQQLARNIFLTQDVTWERKLTEMYVAMELEKKFTKNKILEFYINNIYFANGYYGIEAAAQGYFDKSVDELTLSQLVFLAGIPNNPSKYDPVNKFEAALDRRNYILKQLLAEGYITSRDYYDSMDEQVVLVDNTKDVYNYVETYVFYCATRALMAENGFEFQNDFATEEDEKAYNDKYDEWYSKYQSSLYTNGYQIYTAIDMDKQELLQNILDDKLSDFKGVNNEGIYTTQGAAVCIDNSTGLVTAIVGGRSQDYKGYTLNRAYQSYRQPGSSIKPLNVYAPYLTLGHTADEEVYDDQQVGGPNNVLGVYRGKITLAEALGWSSNVCAWNIMKEMTPAYGMSYLHAMNFKKISVDDDNQNASIGGFTYGVSPVELASGYATLENNGVYREPSCISKITESNGQVIVDNKDKTSMVYQTTVAQTVTKMMEFGVNYGILTTAKLKNAIVAAKSGTTNDSKDGWLAGYSRYYTTVVWVGNDMPTAVAGLSGGSYPLDIWRDYMEKIHEGLERKPFPDFENEPDILINGTKDENEPETETETHPAMPDSESNMGDGDHYAGDYNDGDVDVDLSRY